MAFDPPHVPAAFAGAGPLREVSILLAAASTVPDMRQVELLLGEALDVLAGEPPPGERGSQRGG